MLSKIKTNLTAEEIAITEQITWLKNTMGKGTDKGYIKDIKGNIIKRYSISNNELWYSNYYKIYHKKPSQKELRKIAIEQLTNGYETYNGIIPANPLFENNKSTDDIIDLPVVESNFAKPDQTNLKVIKKEGNNMNKKEIILNAVRGIQAKMEYYVAMIRLKDLKKLITNEENVSVEEKSQRQLSKSRIPKIKKYILTNKDSYIFNSLTASIDGDVEFKPVADDKNSYNIGQLIISADAKIKLNDGQHRHAGILSALEEDKSLGDETISIQFHIDLGLKKSQQRFADLNRNIVKPTSSLNITYDNRDITGNIIKDIIPKIPFFSGRIELEKVKLAKSSTCLTTLNTLYNASNFILKANKDTFDNNIKRLLNYWVHVSNNMQNWIDLAQYKMTFADNRELNVSGYAVTINALGIVGSKILKYNNWEYILEGLKDINFSRDNPDFNNIILKNGNIMGTKECIKALSEYILKQLETRIKECSLKSIDKPTKKLNNKKVEETQDKLHIVHITDKKPTPTDNLTETEKEYQPIHDMFVLSQKLEINEKKNTTPVHNIDDIIIYIKKKLKDNIESEIPIKKLRGKWIVSSNEKDKNAKIITKNNITDKKYPSIDDILNLTNAQIEEKLSS